MSKWTPGPWHLDPRAKTHVVSKNHGICSTGGWGHTQGNIEQIHAEQEATARLIAAAPELYEALDAMVRHFLANDDGELPADLYDSPFYHEALREWYPKCLAALAKARGDQ